MNFSVTGIVDNQLAKNNELEERLPRFRMSDMGRCLRMRYYKRANEAQDPLNARVLRVFKIGHKVHEMFQDAFEDSGMLLSKEVEITDTGFSDPIVGHYDALLDPFANDVVQIILPRDRRGENLILVDMKTVNSNKFHYYDKTRQIDPHYILQIHEYCRTLRKNGYPGLTDCRILYISKDDASTREVLIPFTEEKGEIVRKELEALTTYWNNQELPPAIPKMDWECKYCPFMSICPRGQQIMQGIAQEEAKTYKL